MEQNKTKQDYIKKDLHMIKREGKDETSISSYNQL